MTGRHRIANRARSLALVAAAALLCALPRAADADADTATLAHPVALTKLRLPGFFGYTSPPSAAASARLRDYVARVAAEPLADRGQFRVTVDANPQRDALRLRLLTRLRQALSGVPMRDVSPASASTLSPAVPSADPATAGATTHAPTAGMPAPQVAAVSVELGTDRAIYAHDIVVITGHDLARTMPDGTFATGTVRLDLGHCGAPELAVLQADAGGRYLVVKVSAPLPVDALLTPAALTVTTAGGTSNRMPLVYHAALQTVSLRLPIDRPTIGEIGTSPEPVAGCADFAGDCYGTFTIGEEARLIDGYTNLGATVTLAAGGSPCIEACESRAVIASTPNGTTLRTKVEWFSVGMDPAWTIVLTLRGPEGARPLSTSDASHDPCGA